MNVIDSIATVIHEPVIGSGGGGCFRAGTKVQLKGGMKQSIETLKEGDEVLSFDEQGNTHLARVTKLHIHEEPQPILKVRFWNGVIFITPNHWVLNQYGSFVEIGSLTEHDAVVDGMGHLRPIISSALLANQPVYNLTVEPHHTFIADGIRVHNGGHRERYPVVTGAGGGSSKGGGGGRAAIEDGDTLESKASIKIIDLIGEGLIGGLVDGARSIFLNETPLQNSASDYNFTNVTWDQRTGSQVQTIIPGFSSVESPHTMGSVTVLSGVGNAVPFTITNANTDRVRIIVNVPALLQQDTITGDVHGASVTYHFICTYNGTSVTLGSSTISGKTKSKYQRSHVFTLPKPLTSAAWIISMVRDTADSVTSALSNVIQLDSYVEIVDVKINYANSALMSVGIDPKVFSSVPARSYLVDGLLIQVPSNRSQNSTTKVSTYTGIWNGSFTPGVCSNPAWVLYDLLVTKRYGLGNHLISSQIDKAMLYTIGRYCDEMVDNGMGGTEPRFEINTQIQTQAEAYKLISDITSTFRGMAYWNGGMVGFRQDSPQTPSMIFNQANVANGEFSYASSSRKDRHSVVNVTWNDPAANYKQRVEYVEDHELIVAMGIKNINTVAFGCTSRGQANRVGKWILYSEKYEMNVITFKTGLDASMLLPGEVVRICDAFKSSKRAGGRVIASTTTSITVDTPVAIALSGSGLTSVSSVDVFISMPDGSFAQRTLLETTGTFATLTWTSPLQTAPDSNAIFVLSDVIVPMLARVSAVAQDGKDATSFIVTATEHNPTKYAAVESGALLKIPQTSVAPPYITDINSIVYDETTYFLAPGVIGSKFHVYWSGKASLYRFSYRTTNAGAPGASNWKTIEIKVANYDIDGLEQGTIVDIRVSGMDFSNKWTTPIPATYTVLGKSAPPNQPTDLAATSMIKAISLDWTNPIDIDFSHVEIFANTVNDSSTATLIASTTDNTYLANKIGNTLFSPSSTPYYFWLKSVDTTGNHSAFTSVVSGTTTAEVGYMVTLLTSQLGSSALNLELGDRINLIDAASTGLVSQVGANTTAILTAQSAVDGVNAKYTVKIDTNGYVSGYGLISTAVNGTVISGFSIRADSFSITNPAVPGATGQNKITPFSVLTTPINGNGVSLPAGVYMDSAFITKLNADQINTNGLTIRDNVGTIIFSSGTNLDYDRIAGTNRPENGATRNVSRGNWVTATSYVSGDIVIDSLGNGWSCILAHTSGAIVVPVLPTTSNANWTLYAAKGTDSISAVISNDTHVFPATSAGVVSDYTGAGTTIRVYDGSTEVAYDGVGTGVGTWNVTTSSVNITPSTKVDSGTFVTYPDPSSGVISTVDTASITYTISGKRYNGSAFTLVAQQSFAKSKAGIAGSATANAGAFAISNSGSIFVKDNSGSVLPGGGIVVTTHDQNITLQTYQWYKNGASISLATASSYTIPVADYATLTTNTYKCIVTGTINAVPLQTLEDSITVPLVIDGLSSPTVILSNENITFPATLSGYAGVTFTGGDCDITAYIGLTKLAYAATGANTFSCTNATVSGCTVATGTGVTYTYSVVAPSAMSADKAYNDVIITIRDGAGTALPTVIKRINYSLSRVGSTGLTGLDGAQGPTVNISSNRPATFVSVDDVLTASQTNLVFTANLSGITGTTYAWTFYNDLGVAVTLTGVVVNAASCTITQTDFVLGDASRKSLKVVCIVNGTAAYTDHITVARLDSSTAAAGATKSNVYRQTTAPTGGVYSTNDLWFNTTASDATLYQWNGSAWSPASTVGAQFNNIYSVTAATLIPAADVVLTTGLSAATYTAGTGTLTRTGGGLKVLLSSVAATDIITTTAVHGYATAQGVRYDLVSGTAITGLTDNVVYYVILLTTTTFKLASTAALATAGTALAIGDHTVGSVYNFSAAGWDCSGYTPNNVTVTIISIAASVITSATHNYVTGDGVVYTDNGTAISGLVHGTLYYVIKVTATTFKLATTLANATAGTFITLGAMTGGTTYTITPYTTAGAKFTFSTVDVTSTFMCGLSNDSTLNASYVSIDYAIYINNSSVYVYENGVNRGYFESQVAGDDFAVLYDGLTTVSYYHNGTQFYASTVVKTTLPLCFDSSLIYYGSSFTLAGFGVYAAPTLVTAANALGRIHAGNASTYIANAAIGTAEIRDLTVTTGKFADLSVTTGKIANLAVNTLQLAGQAVTIPVSAYTAAQIVVGNSPTYTIIQTVTIVSTGAPIFIWGQANCVSNYLVNASFGMELGWGAQFYVTRNGTILSSWGQSASGVQISLLDTPGVGTFTYNLEVSAGTKQVSFGSCTQRMLMAMEVKK